MARHNIKNSNIASNLTIPSTMQSKTMVCSNCAEHFELTPAESIYRCGDTYVCSHRCSQKRYRDLNKFDPGLDQPHTWPFIYDNIIQKDREIRQILIENIETNSTNVESDYDEDHYIEYNTNVWNQLCNHLCRRYCLPIACAVSLVLGATVRF